jgi:hypothetical protein
MKLISDVGYFVVDLAQPLFLDFTTGIAAKDCCDDCVGDVVCDLDLSAT